MIFRQGDVIIRKISKIDAKLVKNNSNDDVILAKGEATGHAHRIKTADGEVELYEKHGTLYLKVINNNATVTHEEHNEIKLPKGNYKVQIQREYIPGNFRNIND